MSPLAKKLQLKPNSEGLIINDPEFFQPMLDPLPEGASITTTGSKRYDYVHVFVHDMADMMSRLPSALNRLKPDAVFWVSYPKKTGDIATRRPFSTRSGHA